MTFERRSFIRVGRPVAAAAVLLLGCDNSQVLAPAPTPGATAFTSLTAQASFYAEVKGPWQGANTKPGGCANDAFVCGSASIAGIGPAVYSYFVTSIDRTPAPCIYYTALVTFVTDDGSALTLAESGEVCGPGKSLFPQPAPGGSYGNPAIGTGKWEVLSATGQFAGTTGSGTNTFRSAGARLTAVYIGILD